MHRAARLAAVVAVSMLAVSLPCSDALSLPGVVGNPFAKAVSALEGMLRRNQPEKPPQLSEATPHLYPHPPCMIPGVVLCARSEVGGGGGAVRFSRNPLHGPSTFSLVGWAHSHGSEATEWRLGWGACRVQEATGLLAAMRQRYSNPDRMVLTETRTGAIRIFVRTMWDRVPRGWGQLRTAFRLRVE